MSGIKYYQLAKGEEMPDEFCVVRDVDSEPSEYMFYVPEAENAKLRELIRNLLRVIPRDVSGVVVGAHGEHPTYYSFVDAMRELGIEVEE